MALPPSQKADARPISWTLTSGSGGVLSSVTLVVRPENLRRSEPALQTVTPTLAGAFVDDYGPGVVSITLNGNTGWSAGAGWEENFRLLRTTVWERWHLERRAAVDRGDRPDTVQLVFNDMLDNICVSVSPGKFDTFRSKSNPLLMMFDIGMTMLSNRITGAQDSDALGTLGPSSASDLILTKDSVAAQFANLQNLSTSIPSITPAGQADAASALIGSASALFGRVGTALGAGVSALASPSARSLIGLTSDVSLAGRNAFASLGGAAGITPAATYGLGSVASVLSSVQCALNVGYRPPPLISDYSSVLGASNGSDITGGAPPSAYATSNTFEAITPDAAAASLSVSPTARAAIDALRAMDPVLAPIDLAQVGALMAAVAGGVVLT